MGLVVTGVPVLNLLEEPVHLVFRVVEFGKSIGNFASRNEKLKTIRQVRVGFAPSGQRRYLHRITDNKRGLEEFGLHQHIKQLGNDFPQTFSFSYFDSPGVSKG